MIRRIDPVAQWLRWFLINWVVIPFRNALLWLPTIMIGVNQSERFPLFMVIIAAHIGTQDPGQEMQRALSTTDIGKGLVPGLAVACTGLRADHLITRWPASRTAALGLATTPHAAA